LAALPGGRDGLLLVFTVLSVARVLHQAKVSQRQELRHGAAACSRARRCWAGGRQRPRWRGGGMVDVGAWRLAPESLTAAGLVPTIMVAAGLHMWLPAHTVSFRVGVRVAVRARQRWVPAPGGVDGGHCSCYDRGSLSWDDREEKENQEQINCKQSLCIAPSDSAIHDIGRRLPGCSARRAPWQPATNVGRRRPLRRTARRGAAGECGAHSRAVGGRRMADIYVGLPARLDFEARAALFSEPMSALWLS